MSNTKIKCLQVFDTKKVSKQGLIFPTPNQQFKSLKPQKSFYTTPNSELIQFFEYNLKMHHNLYQLITPYYSQTLSLAKPNWCFLLQTKFIAIPSKFSLLSQSSQRSHFLISLPTFQIKMQISYQIQSHTSFLKAGTHIYKVFLSNSIELS